MRLVLVFLPIAFLFFGSQAYWILRVRAFLRDHIGDPRRRVWAGAAALALYAFLVALNFGWLGRRPAPVRLTLSEALLAGPFQWWVACSMAAFLVVLVIWLVRIAAHIVKWLRAKLARAPEVVSPARRQFLERAATAAVAAPFVAGTYGAFYGRLNLETPVRRIRLARLPKAFHGVRIAQLSDIHIGPFMTEEQIRKYAGIANALKPDLTVLTGDFVTWDASTQDAVVRALSGLRAPLGVFGCLGNHDAWARVEDSITRLFKGVGIPILRHARVPVTVDGESLNLMGVDYMRRTLPGVEELIAPDRVNILLSHNPATFDRAAELGIDLSLAGHTHGGQVTLEFISPQIAPSRIVTPYVSGWFGKPGGQLYVNRGIGTIGVPIRLGARPEITIFELVTA